MLPKILKNFALFVNGDHYAGRADEIVLPKLTIKTEEFRAGGLDTPIEIELGTEKLNLEFTVSEYNPELLSLWGLTQGGSRGFSLRGSLENDVSMERLLVEGLGKVKEVDFGTIKAQEKSTCKFVMSLVYYKVTIADTRLIEIDVINMRRYTGGYDQLLARRLNLGI